MRHACRLFAVTAVVIATAVPTHAQDAQYAGPTVSIRIMNAWVAPQKTNGHAWDGSALIDSDIVKAAGACLGLANPYVALAAAMAPIANKIFQPPDPHGYARVLWAGVPYPCPDDTPLCQTIDLPKQQDTYSPVWNATLPSFELTDSTTIEVSLADADIPGPDDQIGTVILRARDIRRAMANGGAVTAIQVDSQTNGQLYFVGISVFRQ